VTNRETLGFAKAARLPPIVEGNVIVGRMPKRKEKERKQ
jgi:hypothetical protein